VWNVSKSAQQTTLATVGTGTSPALTANSILGGDWGDRLRTLMVAGSGTSAGAAQTILITLSV
jgi:cellobiose phosphorylase